MYNGRSCNAKRALRVYTPQSAAAPHNTPFCSEANNTLPLFMLAANCGRSDNSSLHHCYVHHEFWAPVVTVSVTTHRFTANILALGKIGYNVGCNYLPG